MSQKSNPDEADFLNRAAAIFILVRTGLGFVYNPLLFSTP